VTKLKRRRKLVYDLRHTSPQAGPSEDTASCGSKFEDACILEGIPKARDMKAFKNIDFECIPISEKFEKTIMTVFLKQRYATYRFSMGTCTFIITTWFDWRESE
jgi:hypothetical protein